MWFLKYESVLAKELFTCSNISYRVLGWEDIAPVSVRGILFINYKVKKVYKIILDQKKNKTRKIEKKFI